MCDLAKSDRATPSRPCAPLPYHFLTSKASSPYVIVSTGMRPDRMANPAFLEIPSGCLVTVGNAALRGVKKVTSTIPRTFWSGQTGLLDSYCLLTIARTSELPPGLLGYALK